MGYLRAKDTVNGALGTCFAIIDGKRHELMQVKNVQAKVKKTRTAKIWETQVLRARIRSLGEARLITV